MNNFFIGIIIFMASGFLAKAVAPKYKAAFLSIVCALASLFLLEPATNVLASGNILEKSFNFNPIFQNVTFSIDALSAFFILVIVFASLMSIFYSKGYLAHYVEQGKSLNSHLVFLPMLVASMLLVVTCSNALMFLVCWEIMSLSSFFLVIFEGEKKEVLKAGIKYLVFMHISVIFIIIAFALMALNSGSFEFSEFAKILHSNSHLANLVFTLAFIGFGTKAGFVPFHNWLPDAHPAAPSHVSAIMSGVMIKTGVYGILRMLALISHPNEYVGYLILVVSVISSLYGVLYAIGQHDLKRLLAYHSIENIGIIGIGVGVGTLGLVWNNPFIATVGFVGGILHILNHSIFKELLFLAAGNVYIKTHTKNIEVLGGLIKSMPQSAILFLIGSVAICGLPPFNGFISEFLIYVSMFKGLSVHNFFSLLTLLFSIAALALVGTMAILCFSKAFSIIFLGNPRSGEALQVKDDVENSMVMPMTALAAVTLLIGLFPKQAFEYVSKPVQVFVGGGCEPCLHVTSLLQTISGYALALLIFIVVLVVLKLALTKGRVELHNTWGCGYNRGNNRMQYSASSYANPFLTMLKPLFKKVFDVEKPRKLFPKKAHYNSHIDDIEEAYLINPIVRFDEWFLSKFEAIQSGNIQSYIKYGMIFLALVLIGSLLAG